MAEGKANFLKKLADSSKIHSVDFMTIWTHYDKDRSGYLETKELDLFLFDLMVSKTGKEPEAEFLAELRNSILETVDANKDGRIELGEFAQLLPVEENFMRRFGDRKELTRKDFNDIFLHYDPDCNGFIEGRELLALIHDILCKSGKSVTLKELEDYKDAAMRVFDKNSDGKLSRRELGLLLSIDK